MLWGSRIRYLEHNEYLFPSNPAREAALLTVTDSDPPFRLKPHQPRRPQRRLQLRHQIQALNLPRKPQETTKRSSSPPSYSHRAVWLTPMTHKPLSVRENQLLPDPRRHRARMKTNQNSHVWYGPAPEARRLETSSARDGSKVLRLLLH